MTRWKFPQDRLVFRYGAPGTPLYAPQGDTLTICTDAGGHTPADIQYPNGTTVPASLLSIGADCLIPEFLGPNDGSTILYAVNGLVISELYAQVEPRLEATDPRYLLVTQRGAANGVASLDGSGKVPSAQIPGGGGGGGAVDSVNGQTGTVVLAAADVGALDQSAGDARYAQISTVPVVGAAGSGASKALSANDPTTTNSRSPLPHAGTHASGGADPVTPAAIGALRASNNLSDLTNANSGRTALGLGNSATLPVGTSSGTVAAGDDGRITGAVQAATLTTRGDLLAGTGSGAVRLAVGSTGQVLSADSTQSTGVKWITPPSGSPTGSAGGDLGGTYPNPSVLKINGVTVSNAPTANQILTATGTTAASWTDPSATVVISTTATDIAPLGTRAAGSSGKAADASHVHAMPRLDQVLAPTAAVALNAQKLTGVANGTASTDGAAFGQIPLVGAAGAGAGVALSSTDASVTNARTPTAHAASHATGGSDALTPAAIGAVAVDALFYNAKDHGVVGDGTSVDSAALQTLVNTVATAGGGTVYLPPGTYVVSAVYLASNITLLGAGMGSTVLKLDPAATPGTNAIVIRVANGSTTAASWVTVRDLTIDGNKAAFPSPAGKVYGYYLGTGTAGLVTDCLVESVEFRNCPTYALDIVNALRVSVTDCFSHDNGAASGTNNACSGFEILADDVTLVNCRAVNNAVKGFTSGESGVVHYRTKLIGCTAQGNLSDGMYFHDGLTDSAILGGTSRNNTGSGVVMATAAVRNTVVGVTASGNAVNGFRIDAGTYNILSACIADANATASVGNPEVYLVDAAMYNTVDACIVNSSNSNTSIVEHDTSDHNVFRSNTYNKTFTLLGANSSIADPGIVTSVNTHTPTAGAVTLAVADIAGALAAANNLSELTLPATARTNLGLGGAAVLNVGTTAGTVMAGNDNRIAGSLQASVWRRRDIPGPNETTRAYDGPDPLVTLTASSTTTISSGAAYAPNTANFQYQGAAGFAFGSGGDSVYYLPTSQTPHTYASPQNTWAVEFDTDAQVFEVGFKYVSAATTYRLSIDGRAVTDLPQATGATSAGAAYMLKFDLKTGLNTPKRIRLDFCTMPFRGVYLPPTDTLWKPVAGGGRFMLFGDDLSDGASANTGGGTGTWLYRTGRMLGVQDVWEQGRTGTGYITAGSFDTLANRLAADVVAYTPDRLVVWAGYNDSGGSQPAIGTAASALFTAIASGLPTCQTYVVGCWSPSGSPTSALTSTDATLQTAAAGASLPFLSPITGSVYDKTGTLVTTLGPWITGTGKVGSTTGTGIADWAIGADGVHPTDAGHLYLSRRIFSSLRALMPA